jgi:hypothetical protein
MSLSYMDTDFLDYCIGVVSLDHVELRTPYKRSAFAALPSYAFGRAVGLVNGMALASIAAYLGILYTAVGWLRSYAQGRVPILCCLALFCSMAPLLSLGRMFNFYPEVIFFTFLGGFLVKRALERADAVGFFLGGAGVSLAFLSDVRGLVWGLPFLFLLLGRLIWAQGRHWLVLALASSLSIGWKLGGWSYHRFHSPFSRQLDVRPLYNQIDKENPLYQPPYEYPEGFLWGRSGLDELLEELRFLVDQALMPTPEGFYTFSEVSEPIYAYWLFWLCAGLISLGYLVYSCRGDLRRLFGLLPLLPFALCFVQLPSVVEPHVRFYAQAFPALLVLVGAALGHAALRVPRPAFVLAPMVLAIPLAVVLSPPWHVSRLLMNTHLASAFPTLKPQLFSMPIQTGPQVHLFVSPITKQEAWLASSWWQYCEERLQREKVTQPFYVKGLE